MSAKTISARSVVMNYIEVTDSRTGYLFPARDGPGALPNRQSSWDVAAVAAAAARPPGRPATQSIGSDT